MAKKAQYEAIAKQYYVEMQMSIATIAKRLNITEKTLRDWKNEGEWEKERINFLNAQYKCYGSLYQLVYTLSNHALEEYKTTGSLPEAKNLSFIAKMADKLPKMKQFENTLLDDAIKQVTEVEQREEKEENLDVKIAKKINSVLIGE